MHAIVVNGSTFQIEAGSTLADLLQQLELDKTMVAIEQNAEIVPKTEFSVRVLEDGDRVEIVHFVGGG